MPEYQELLDLCHLPFKYWEHEFIKGNIYVNVHSTIVRLNSLGVPWSLQQEQVREWPNEDDNKMKWDALCEIQLTIEGMGSRGAPGGASGTDRGDTAKSAHSYALRKAASLFGIGHYLMTNPAAESNLVNFMNVADMSDLTSIKKAIKLISDIEGVDPKTFLTRAGMEPSEFSDVEKLKNVLISTGRI